MLDHLLTRLGSCTLFVAPPAWGKTRMLLELHHKESLKMIFISPLKALALEFYESLPEEKNRAIIHKKKECKKIINTVSNWNYGLLITTAEMIDDNFLDRLEGERYLVILDEFHLYYYWGQTFREHLFELLMALANRRFPILGLSATISSELFIKWKQDFGVGADELFYLDVGNQQLKYPPSKTIFFFRQSLLERRLSWNLTKRRKGAIIYFCAFRHQVDLWVSRCKELGLCALGCKGGEVELFSTQLKMHPRPDIIFATTALSHGVNLPPVYEIYIDYPVKNLDFWVQMVGRGGRRKESYKLYCRDRFNLTTGEIIKNIIYNSLFDVLIRGGLYFRQCKLRLKE